MQNKKDDYDEAPKRNRYACADGYCGADDCSTCHPLTGRLEPEDEE